MGRGTITTDDCAAQGLRGEPRPAQFTVYTCLPRDWLGLERKGTA